MADASFTPLPRVLCSHQLPAQPGLVGPGAWEDQLLSCRVLRVGVQLHPEALIAVYLIS